MKQSVIRFVVASVATIVVAGCSIYHPQSVDIPLINHQGDSRLDVSASISATVFPDVLTLGATYSYGFNDWLAGQVHLNYGGENIYAQLAPGAYLNLGDHGLLEGYAGLGGGGVWRDHTDQSSDIRDYSYSGSFLLPFVQANIGVHDVGKVHFDAAFGVKAGAYMPSLDYMVYDTNGVHIPEKDYHYGSPNFLLEPQLMLRLGSERVRWNLRLSYAWLSDMAAGGGEHFTYDFFTVGTGLTFAF